MNRGWVKWTALAGAAAFAAAWVWRGAGAPFLFLRPKFAWTECHTKDVLCPRQLPNLRGARCTLPAIPHAVERDGLVPPCRRVRTFTYSTNSGKFRGAREISPRKAPDTLRIVVLGTGVTFGNGVDDAEVYPALLERRLAERPLAPGRRVEVCNMGLPGSCTDEGVARLKDVAGRYDFDLLVFCFGVNDGLRMFRRTADDYAATLRDLMEFTRARGLNVLFALEPRSSFYPWPYAEYEARFRAIVLGDPANRVLDLPAVLDRVEMQRGLRLDREGGVQRVVRYRAGRGRVLKAVAYAPQGDELAIAPEIYEYLDSHGVDQAAYIDGVHLNEEGHRLVAAELESYLREHPELWTGSLTGSQRMAPPAAAAEPRGG